MRNDKFAKRQPYGNDSGKKRYKEPAPSPSWCRAQRPCHERQRKDDEAVERARQWIDKREDQRRENQHRGDRINEEIEKFRRPADNDADGNFARRDMAMARVDRAGVALAATCAEVLRRLSLGKLAVISDNERQSERRITYGICTATCARGL